MIIHFLIFHLFYAGLRRSRVPSRPAGRDPGRDGTGFFKGIFEKTRPVEIVQKTFGIVSLILKKFTHSLNTFIIGWWVSEPAGKRVSGGGRHFPICGGRCVIDPYRAATQYIGKNTTTIKNLSRCVLASQ